MAFSIVHQVNRGFHTLPEKKLYKISDLGSRIAVSLSTFDTSGQLVPM
jgi:hypothetical protein